MTDAETSLEAETSPKAKTSHEEPSPAPAAEGTAEAPTGTDAAGRPWPPFAHGSETEMARILDFYEVRWDYEPRTFPILWNLDGDVVESFSPDFYLPDLDLFLEMTTLKQRLVRKKNRKLRRLRELYPDIRIKLFYARDFRAMMLKYGRLALADSLSGTLGQVVPERGREPDLVSAAAELPGPAIDAGSGSGGALGAGNPGGPTPGITDGAGSSPVVASRPASVTPTSSAGGFVAGSAQLPAAPGGSGGGPVARPNASRSRRRRAAAAARAAAREPADASARRATSHLQEDPGSR